jgi:signal transduction histidine kinase/phage shock protein PspC (stress-responsive transcriptional regulator)
VTARHEGSAGVARDTENRVLGGVCSGLARALGVDPLIVRVAMVAAVFAGGFGLVLYAAGMLLLPPDDGRPFVRRIRTEPGVWRVTLGVASLSLSALLVARELGLWWTDAIVWPVVIALAGVALIWQQAAGPRTERRVISKPREVSSEAKQEDEHSARGLPQAGFGIALVVGAGLLFLSANGALSGARDVVLWVVVVFVSAGLILAPLWIGLVRRLTAERAERIRSQERAEVATHLHDSVLQTLALVQQRASDPAAVATLARRQERELRAWLSGAPEARPDEQLADALQSAAEEVVERFGVPIDFVAVGDRALDERTRAVVAAAREALSNAAKHAGGAPIALYMEVTPQRTEVFVRDRGGGFDVDAVPADRHGVRESIIGRMQRHGGSATITSSPGAGTEVALILEQS